MNHTMDGDPTEKEKERWAESIRRAKDNLKQLSEEEQSFVKTIIAEVEKLKSKMQSDLDFKAKEEI